VGAASSDRAHRWVDALVAITRPQFRATGEGTEAVTYRVAPAAVRATLGIAVRLR